MAQLEEAVLAKDPLASDLAAGVDSLSRVQEITFTRYVRLILPLDGYAFWVRSSIVGPSAQCNALLPNRVGFNQAASALLPPPTFVVKGSLHYTTEIRQKEPETYAANRVVFTSEEEVQDLNAVAPNTLWIGEFDGIRFAFSSRSSFYKQADLFHYVGFAVYADMATQIVDTPNGFDSQSVVVSNSLPAWLAINGYHPPYGFPNPGLTLFPSFLGPENLVPPYVAVHIAPETTRGLAMAPWIGPRTSSHSQLCAERVKLTVWGTRNFTAMDLVDCVNQYSLDTGLFGLMNSPVLADEKRTQPELLTLAMKKSITYEVSYNQSRMRDVAQQLIESAVPSFYVAGKAA